MADIKITALPEDTAPTIDDLVILVNDPGGGAVTRRATIENLWKPLEALSWNSSPWVDVRYFMDGLAGRPTYATWYADQENTDVITVLNAASAAATGIVWFPSGIYAISSTFVLKTNTAYIGSPSGTYPSSEEHPTAGYGAAIRWIGAASGVMVSAYNVYNTMWDGIDLDGVDYTDDVTGIKHYSNNTPTSQHCTFRNFNAFNLGYGMIIGDNNGVTHYQTDGWVVERFVMYMVNYGIKINSQNGSQYSSVRNGQIGCYYRGVSLASASGDLDISNIAFLGLTDAGAGAAWIYIGGLIGEVKIVNCSGEPVPGTNTGWYDILFIGGSMAGTVVSIENSIISGGIVTQAGTIAKITSMNNFYKTGEYEDTGIVLVDSNMFVSINDTFKTVDDKVYETGANNSVTYINPYHVDEAWGYTIFRYTYDAVSIFEMDYLGQLKLSTTGISVHADNAAALAAGHVAGDVYMTATGQLMVVY